MEFQQDSPGTVRFGPFELSIDRRELRKAGSRIKLHGQSFVVLQALIYRKGAVVTREELRKLLWPDRQFGNFDHSLNMIVNRLRERFGDVPDDPTYIETVPGKGYRFVARVLVAGADDV